MLDSAGHWVLHTLGTALALHQSILLLAVLGTAQPALGTEYCTQTTPV